MNSRIILSLILIGCLSSCGPSEKELLQAELDKVKQENEAFRSQASEMTVSIESYQTLLKEINKSLKAIDNSTLMTKNMKAELKSDKDIGAQILTRIKTIHAMMESAKMKVQALDRTLNELRKKYGDQSEEVLSLNRELKEVAQELVEREAEFTAMKSEFEGDVDGLESALAEQLKVTEELKDMLDRAFYFAGTRSELNEKGIVEKEGGFIGIGRVKVLNAKSPDQMFTKISKEGTERMEFASKKIALITMHAENSYAINETDTSVVLTIRDKKAFWKQSNYLVIQTGAEK